ncbi:MAG: alpha-galactosidase [Phycicoccus sp.]
MSTATTVLRGGGTAVVLVQVDAALPYVAHWGRDLPDDAVADLVRLAADRPVPPNALDSPWDFSVLPTGGEGWLGTPGFEAHRAGGRAAPRWVADVTTGGADVDTGGAVVIRAVAEGPALEVRMTYRLDSSGVLTVDTVLSSTADDSAAPLDVGAVRALLPLPARAAEVLDLGGRWVRERAPQRHPLLDGTWSRTGRRGRTGHDAALLMCCGTAGFGFRHGEVWAAHVGWSGNHEHLVERLPEGAGAHASVLGGGEALAAGEVRLGAGESYTAPTVYLAYSGEGLDGVTNALLRFQRSRPGYRAGPRPLVLNTWEAVYFDHDLDRLRRLADVAASVGVERFVLDDGWFGSRRGDTSGLGDWQVSPEAWPAGLGPLVEHVRGLGMEFGLWFEPEMVNLDSELARAHPDWVLGPVAGPPLPSRHQHVLDLANPAAFAHVLQAVSALVTEYGIAFVKWDHNRDLHEAVRSDPAGDDATGAGGTTGAGGSTGAIGAAGIDRPAVAAQTRATYALLDELRARHPALEIESCSSGGARVDLGVLARTDRVWVSDCNDALERVAIQRWTGLLVPPERMGTHVGGPRAHTTHRHLDLSFRLLVALQGHAGIELDLTTCTDDELGALRAWSALYRELRPLLHSGDVVRSDHPDEALVVAGVVAPDRSEAVFTVAQVATGRGVTPGAVLLPGLDPARRYRVRVRREAGLPSTVQRSGPRWFDGARPREAWDPQPAGVEVSGIGPAGIEVAGVELSGDEVSGVEVSGAALGEAGLALPVLAPAQGFLLHLTVAP